MLNFVNYGMQKINKIPKQECKKCIRINGKHWINGAGVSLTNLLPSNKFKKIEYDIISIMSNTK